MAPLRHPPRRRSSHLTKDDRKGVTRCNRKPEPITSQYATRRTRTAKARLYYLLRGCQPGGIAKHSGRLRPWMIRTSSVLTILRAPTLLLTAWPREGPAVPASRTPRVLRRAAGERDALVQPEQAGQARIVLDRHRDIAHELAELLGKPVQRCDDHVFEAAGFDLGHQPIVHRSVAARVSSGAVPPAGRRTRRYAEADVRGSRGAAYGGS
jgi:hypothetical protein